MLLLASCWFVEDMQPAYIFAEYAVTHTVHCNQSSCVDRISAAHQTRLWVCTAFNNPSQVWEAVCT